MKSFTDVRIKNQGVDSDDFARHATKLAPAKKSGKERHNLYSSLADEDEIDYKQPRESIRDYYDDDTDL